MLLIHCPACHGTLEVDAAQLMRPRRICCTLCTHRWIEEPPRTSLRAPLPAAPAALEAEQKKIPVPPAEAPAVAATQETKPSERHFGRKRVTSMQPQALPQPSSYGLLASVALLLLLSVTLAARESVVRTWPPSARAFAALGLPVNLHGLEIRDVRTRIVQEPTQKVLTIDGQIKNLRDASQTLPELLLSLRDASGREVYAWKAPPPKSGLARGETIQFRARLAAPPEGANLVRVEFADPAQTRIATR